ncbi:hypothetical protein Tco_1287563 [Tanacetum coccineum]
MILRSTRFYRLSHFEIVDIEKVAVSSSLRLPNNKCALIESYALSWKPCQGDSLNLPNHRIRRRCCSLILAESRFKTSCSIDKDKYMMKAQAHVSKSSAISDVDDRLNYDLNTIMDAWNEQPPIPDPHGNVVDAVCRNVAKANEKSIYKESTPVVNKVFDNVVVPSTLTLEYRVSDLSSKHLNVNDEGFIRAEVLSIKMIMLRSKEQLTVLGLLGL